MMELSNFTFYNQTLITQSNEYLRFMFSLLSIRLAALATPVEDIKFKRLDIRLLKKMEHKGKVHLERGTIHRL